MPTYPVAPEDVLTATIRELQSRVRKLETAPPAGANMMSAAATATTAIPATTWIRCTMGLIYQSIPSAVGTANAYFDFNNAADQILIKKKGLYHFSFYASASAGAGTFYIRGRHVGGWAGGGYSHLRASGQGTDCALSVEYDYYIADTLSSFGVDLYCSVASTTQHSPTADEHLTSMISATYLGDF